MAQIKEQIRLNGGSDIKEEDSEPATSAKDIRRSARLCERQAKNLPKAKLTGREKQKLNTQIDHLFKASDKLCEYENHWIYWARETVTPRLIPMRPSCASRKMP